MSVLIRSDRPASAPGELHWDYPGAELEVHDHDLAVELLALPQFSEVVVPGQNPQIDAYSQPAPPPVARVEPTLPPGAAVVADGEVICVPLTGDPAELPAATVPPELGDELGGDVVVDRAVPAGTGAGGELTPDQVVTPTPITPTDPADPTVPASPDAVAAAGHAGEVEKTTTPGRPSGKTARVRSRGGVDSREDPR